MENTTPTPTIISRDLIRHPIPGQGVKLTDAIASYDNAKDHKVLHRSREDGKLMLIELIKNDYPKKKEMADRVIDSMNRRDDWSSKDGARVGDLKTAKARGDALKKWDGWLKENGAAFFNHWLKVNRESADITDNRTIKRLEALARQEIENEQRSLNVDTTKDDWENMVRKTVVKVFGTPDIKQLIEQFKGAGDRHLHYGKEKGRTDEHLFIRDPNTARKEDLKPHPLAFFFRTASWEAFQNSKVTAVEQVRPSIDRIYGPGMGERVFDAMRQQHGWKRHHGVEGRPTWSR